LPTGKPASTQSIEAQLSALRQVVKKEEEASEEMMRT